MPFEKKNKDGAAVVDQITEAQNENNKLTEDQNMQVGVDARPRAGNDKFIGRAFKIRILPAEGEGTEVFVQPGVLPCFRIRRGAEVIVPLEVIEALDSSVTESHYSDWANQDPRTGNVPLRSEPHFRFPYQNFGEVPWSEYVAFRAEQNKRSF